MLILVAIALLIVLPSPWNLVAFLVGVPVWIVELLAWNRTVKHRRWVVGAQTLIGRDAIVSGGASRSVKRSAEDGPPLAVDPW